jgi:hypothetical protein
VVVVVVVVGGGCTCILHFDVPVEIRANLISTKHCGECEGGNHHFFALGEVGCRV